MKRLILLLLFLTGCSESAAPMPPPQPPAPPAPPPPESARAFAIRTLGLTVDAGHVKVTEARWNGRPVVFVDYPRPLADYPEYAERPIEALWRGEAEGGERVAVTLGDHEGGEPWVEAISFANADADPAEELIVILAWHVGHYDVSGTRYDVRIMDDAKPGLTALAELKSVSSRFDKDECECDYRDRPSTRFRFKTIADVKAELKRLGY